MMKDNENEKRETVADILAEYRNDADAMDRGWLYQPTAEYVRRLLDRIEAAWKREREAVEADALAVGGIVEASRHKPGNAAALREALLRCEAISCLPEIREQQSVRDMRNIIAAALSAPARNCDIYPKRDDAGEAWNMTLDERTRDMVQRYPLTAMDMFIDWLLAYAEDGGVS